MAWWPLTKRELVNGWPGKLTGGMWVIRNKLVPPPMLNLLLMIFSLSFTLSLILQPSSTHSAQLTRILFYLTPGIWLWERSVSDSGCVCVGGGVYLDVAVCCGVDGNIAMVRKQLDHVVLITSRWCQPAEWESTRWHADHTQPFRTGGHWNTQIWVVHKNKQMHVYIL